MFTLLTNLGGILQCTRMQRSKEEKSETVDERLSSTPRLLRVACVWLLARSFARKGQAFAHVSNKFMLQTFDWSQCTRPLTSGNVQQTTSFNDYAPRQEHLKMAWLIETVDLIIFTLIAERGIVECAWMKEGIYFVIPIVYNPVSYHWELNISPTGEHRPYAMSH